MQGHPGLPAKLLYSFRDRNGDMHVAKFVHSYCHELHFALAAIQLAPRLHSVEQLAGGWVKVDMEHLPRTWMSLQVSILMIFLARLGFDHCLTFSPGSYVWLLV